MHHPETTQSPGEPAEILGLGSISVDDFLYVSQYPKEDSKVEVKQHHRCCGGLTGTALVAASRLGARCAYAGALGWDELSKYCIRQLEREGISIDFTHRDLGGYPIHSTIVVSEATATRNIFYDVAGFKGLPADWPEESILTGLKVLLVDNFSIEAQVRLATMARQQGIPVVADFEDDHWPGFDELLALCDHLILSSAFAKRITGCTESKKAVRKLWQDDRAMVSVTCGREGAFFMTGTASGEATEVRHQGAFNVEAIDTTGCGDVFHGAYASGLVRGESISDSLRFATAAAAINATRLGGQQGIPTFDEVNQFLETF